MRPSELSLFCNADETALIASLLAESPNKARFDQLAKAVQERIPALTGAELLAETRIDAPPQSIARWGASSLSYRAANFDYRVDHGAFFQVNRWLIDSLVESVTAGHSGSLAWDLFAGVGLFARRLASTFARVVAVESAPTAIKALEENLRDSSGSAVGATTLDFLRSNPKSGQPDLIVVDPPRIGLGPDITSLLVRVAAPALVYVSCDPATLARDLKTLIAGGYQIQSLTLADLFPQTFHIETIVHVRRS
jgi:23S rRNA (uracil1939-C5)-methyltransferase